VSSVWQCLLRGSVPTVWAPADVETALAKVNTRKGAARIVASQPRASRPRECAELRTAMMASGNNRTRVQRHMSAIVSAKGNRGNRWW
jgi:hypothetical protein